MNQKYNGPSIKSFKVDAGPKGNAYQNDKLNRAEFGNQLKAIVKNYKDGFVMSLNGPWGTGKTTFFELWNKDLIDDGFNTIYFNAWENDYDNNAFLALYAEINEKLKQIIKVDENSNYDKLIKSGTTLLTTIGKAGLTIALNKVTGLNSEEFKDLFKGLSEGVTKIMADSLTEYSARKKNIKTFQDQLTLCLKEANNDKPLVFIVDELDRCRPSYAVEVLETIKHLFAVDGIVFVLGIDKKHLISSIKGVYGSPDIDGQEYLRRFIDLEISLPNAPLANYIEHLISVKEFDKIISKDPNNIGSLDRAIRNITTNKVFTLRQLEKVFANVDVLRTLKSSVVDYDPFIYLLLISIKITDEISFENLKISKLNIPQVYNLIGEYYSQSNNPNSGLNINVLVTYVVFLYVKMAFGNPNNGSVFDKSGNEFSKTNELKLNNEDFEECINISKRLYDLRFYRGNYSLKLFFDNIDLVLL